MAEVLDIPEGAESAPLVLICVDVYVPVDIWAGRSDWHGGASAIAVLSHLSCDWDLRLKLLEAMESAVEAGVNAPAVETGSLGEGAKNERDRAKAVSKGKWKVDEWVEDSSDPHLLNKPPGALVIRDPCANPEPNRALTRPGQTAPLLAKALAGTPLTLAGVQDVVGGCQALGCRLHPAPPPDETKRARFLEEKDARFNLSTLFRSLPSHMDELDGLLSRTTTHMLPGGAPSGTGICDLPDEVLIQIMERLDAPELQRMEAVCRHTRALGAALFPSITLPLFQHQRAAVRPNPGPLVVGFAGLWVLSMCSDLCLSCLLLYCGVTQSARSCEAIGILLH